MSKGDSTRKRSFLGKALVLVGALFASGAVNKHEIAAAGVKSGPRYASGQGWGGSAVYSPRRGKFKGYMRSTSTFNKKKRGLK